MDNGCNWCHKSMAMMVFLIGLGFELLPSQPVYSLDLAPSYFSNRSTIISLERRWTSCVSFCEKKNLLYCLDRDALSLSLHFIEYSNYTLYSKLNSERYFANSRISRIIIFGL